ncbi:MAG: hypothetical protein JWP97_2140 [Labilithrix sp.]|nr:hypothetical protein [Labilithrix sp.]
MLIDPPVSPVAPGDIVAAKYRVERVLGVGGMGVVVRARHTTLDQIVAIKFLVVSRFRTREESVARFLAEARAAASIESDFVCRVFDVGTLEDGTPFMVMEHLEGNDLEEEIHRRGPLPLVTAVDHVLQAADALAAAHQLGIVHRDIKPSNLFLALRPDGTQRVKVLDFGISKIAKTPGTHDARFDGAGPDSDRTSLGTPAYMSPEQVRGAHDVDARADLWGLGAILYELVTGHMAFVGEDVKAVLDHVLDEDPCPINALRRDVPAELEMIVGRCLERDRQRRWPSAALLAAALVPFGSIGVATQLASVQRELGSSASLRIQPTPYPSVQPMVAPARASFSTLPEIDDPLGRESIVDAWTRLRARKRTARAAVLVMASVMLLAGALAILFHGARPVDRPTDRRAAVAAPPVATEVSAIPGPGDDAGYVYPAAMTAPAASPR